MSGERALVVVVGAGLAGLSCADRLAGDVDVVVLEARDRVRGRCWSSRGWDNGQVAEHGGELIEVGQEHVIALAKELGLRMEDRTPTTPTPGRLVVGGQGYLLDDIVGMPAVLDRLAAELAELPGVTYDTADERARALDEMSAQDWLDSRVDGGIDSRLGRAIAGAVQINLGVAPDRLSALALHHMFCGFEDPGGSAESFPFGNEISEDDEWPELGDILRSASVHSMHIAGGNDQLALGLSARLPQGSLYLDSPLTGLVSRSDGRYLVLADGQQDLIADRVVLATPFPPLASVDLSDSGLSPRRLEAFGSLPMGTHRKVLMELDRQADDTPDWPGVAGDVDLPAALWNTGVAQTGSTGLLTLFTPADLLPTGVPHGPASETASSAALDQVERMAPGMRQWMSDRVWIDDWPSDPWAGGSYAAFAPGQYTRFAGFLAEPEGGIHFAGEHTSLASPGYLDGAIASGLRAAEEVLQSLR